MRTARSIKNLAFGAASKIIGFALNFLLRTVVMYTIGIKFLGVDSLFTSILAIISFAEMGVGGVVVSMLYEPVARGEYGKVQSIIRFLRNFYLIVSGIVLAVGLALIYFVPFMVEDTIGIGYDLRIVYLFFLANALIGYFYFYKTTIFIATQNQWVESCMALISTTVVRLLQCLFLFITSNYLVYLSFMPIYHLVSGLMLSIVIYKKFPYLRGKADKLSAELGAETRKRTFAAVYYKLGGVFINSSSAMVITIMLGAFASGVYSNYNFLIVSLNGIMALLTSSIMSGVGNAIVLCDNVKMERIFQRARFIVGSVITIATVCLVVLFNSFIGVWSGAENILPTEVMVMIVVNFYIYQNRIIVDTFKQAAGLYVKDKFRPLIEGVVNLGLAILLAKYLGIFGVVLSTFISATAVSVWSEAYILYKNLFKMNMIKYFSRYFVNMLLTAGLILVVGFIVGYITLPGVGGFILKAVVCLTVSGLLYIAAVFWLPEFKYALGIIKSLFGKLSRKK